MDIHCGLQSLSISLSNSNLNGVMGLSKSLTYTLLAWLCLNHFMAVAAFSLKCRTPISSMHVLLSRQRRSNVGFSENIDHFCVFQNRKRLTNFSSLFASSSESSKSKDGRILRILRQLIIVPLVSMYLPLSATSNLRLASASSLLKLITLKRFLFVRPVTYLLDFFADEMDLDDGTTAVAEPIEQIIDETIANLNDKSSNHFSIIPEQKVEQNILDPGEVEHVKLDQSTDSIKTLDEFNVQYNMEEPTKVTAKSNEILSSIEPRGKRWAVAGAGVDLTGEWELIVTDQFKQDYDRYLNALGQPMLVRSVALGIIALTTEVTKQTDNGKSLLIRGQNVRGTWDRTLVASGTEVGIDEYTPLQIPVMSADSEKVEAESWWENNGRIHVSWLRGVTKYGGGDFESRRFLDGDVYVCESTFHPKDSSKTLNRIIWRFRRRAVAVQ